MNDIDWYNFIDAIDLAKYVKVVRDSSTDMPLAILVWYGGHQISIFNTDGKEVDIRSFGDFSYNEVPLNTVENEMRIIENDILTAWNSLMND